MAGSWNSVKARDVTRRQGSMPGSSHRRYDDQPRNPCQQSAQSRQRTEHNADPTTREGSREDRSKQIHKSISPQPQAENHDTQPQNSTRRNRSRPLLGNLARDAEEACAPFATEIERKQAEYAEQRREQLEATLGRLAVDQFYEEETDFMDEDPPPSERELAFRGMDSDDSNRYLDPDTETDSSELRSELQDPTRGLKAVSDGQDVGHDVDSAYDADESGEASDSEDSEEEREVFEEVRQNSVKRRRNDHGDEALGAINAKRSRAR
jgi:hypothetical protein